MKKGSLLLLTLAYAFSTFGSGIFTPIYAFFVQKIGGGIFETSSAIALFSIVTGIAVLLISRTTWSHTYRKECLVVGWFLWLLSMVMYYCVSTFGTLLLSQVITGLGNALSSPAYDAEFSEQVIDDLSGGWGVFEGVTSIFSGIASVSGGFIVAYYGFDVLFYWMMAILTLSFTLIVYYVYTQKTYRVTSRQFITL